MMDSIDYWPGKGREYFTRQWGLLCGQSLVMQARQSGGRAYSCGCVRWQMLRQAIRLFRHQSTPNQPSAADSKIIGQQASGAS